MLAKGRERDIGGRVAEIERGLPKILKSGGRAADGKDHRSKYLIARWQTSDGWQTAESDSQKLKFFTVIVVGGRQQSQRARNKNY